MNRVDRIEIIENKPIAKGVYQLRLALPGDYPEPVPGQFVNLYLNDKSRLLPRPLSICDWEAGMLTLVYAVVGGGTEVLSRYEPGTLLRVSAPLGNGFTVSQGKSIIIGGGLGVAPMLYLAKKMPQTEVILGFKSETFLVEAFPDFDQLIIATEDGSKWFKGNVLDLLNTTPISEDTQLFACGSKPMLAALVKLSVPMQVSLEERMGCGYGACVGCVCKTINGNKKICEDGPVFWTNEVCWDA